MPARRGISFYVKAAAGAVTLVATVAGAYFAFRSQPAKFGTADWVHSANAACEQDFGPLRLSLFDGLLPSTATTAGQNTSSTQQLTSRVQDWITAEGDLSKQVGDLSAIQTPQDSRAGQVRAVLNSGDALVGSMNTFANVMQTAVDSTSGVTAAQYAAAAKDGDAFLATLLTWQKALKTLNLDDCAFWTNNPASTPATVAPPSAPASAPPSVPVTPPPGSLSLSTGEEQLASQLDPADLTNCTGRPGLEVDGVVAALNCEALSPGPTLRPLVVQFSDIDAASTWFADSTTGFVDRDDCAAGYRLGTWTHYGLPAGPLGCAYLADGDFRMVWVIDGSLIGVIADGNNGTLMYDWWTKWCYVTGGG